MSIYPASMALPEVGWHTYEAWVDTVLRRLGPSYVSCRT
jgi:hypothetical protein